MDSTKGPAPVLIVLFSMRKIQSQINRKHLAAKPVARISTANRGRKAGSHKKTGPANSGNVAPARGGEGGRVSSNSRGGKSRTPNDKCYKCGSSEYLSPECKFDGGVFFLQKRKGHKEAVCMSKKKSIARIAFTEEDDDNNGDVSVRFLSVIDQGGGFGDDPVNLLKTQAPMAAPEIANKNLSLRSHRGPPGVPQGSPHGSPKGPLAPNEICKCVNFSPIPVCSDMDDTDDDEESVVINLIRVGMEGSEDSDAEEWISHVHAVI